MAKRVVRATSLSSSSDSSSLDGSRSSLVEVLESSLDGGDGVDVVSLSTVIIILIGVRVRVMVVIVVLSLIIIILIILIAPDLAVSSRLGGLGGLGGDGGRRSGGLLRGLGLSRRRSGRLHGRLRRGRRRLLRGLRRRRRRRRLLRGLGRRRRGESGGGDGGNSTALGSHSLSDGGDLGLEVEVVEVLGVLLSSLKTGIGSSGHNDGGNSQRVSDSHFEVGGGGGVGVGSVGLMRDN